MLVWGIFIGFIILCLALDLGIFNRKAHEIKTKEASIWTAIWVTVALSFSAVIYWLFSQDLVANPDGLAPKTAVLKYISGYLIELSLSIDNVFVITPNKQSGIGSFFIYCDIPLFYKRYFIW